MNLLHNKAYLEDLNYVSSLSLPWDLLENKTLLITGSTGLFASFLIDVLMYRNEHYAQNCHIYALNRTEAKAKARFEDYWENPCFHYVSHDISLPFPDHYDVKFDYILHLASNTHPLQYATDPVGTITTNILGTKNLLDYTVKHPCKRFVFASSNEIYGENRGDVELFDEKYCGYIDCNTMRAGYPESKRCSEALCQAFLKQHGTDVVISRFTRSYGPTLLQSDTKALSQFLHKGLSHENIVLKSEGTQYYSYTYVADAVSGLLTIMLKGKTGEAYNIADISSDIRLKDLAQIIATQCNVKVVFDLPDEIEQSGYSKATKARLDSTKLKELGWKANYPIEDGIRRTLKVLASLAE